MIVKLLTEHHLEFPSFKGGCTGSSESTLVKMLHCWKSHVTACAFWEYLTETYGTQNSNGSGQTCDVQSHQDLCRSLKLKIRPKI